MLVRYQPIDDAFAGLPNRVLRSTLIQSYHMRGLEILIRAHRRVFDNLEQEYDELGRPVAKASEVMAIKTLGRLIGELTADAALDAQGLN